MVRLTLSEIRALAASGGYAGLALITQQTAVTILSAAVWLDQLKSWRGEGYELTEAEIDEIQEIVAVLENQIMGSAIGLILPSVRGVLSDGVLPCDGSLYLRVDYPELYDAIDPVFHVDAGSFRVPDLAGRFVGGTRAGFEVGDTGGNARETLNINQMPIHNHTVFAYQNIPIPEGGGVPNPLAVIAPALPQKTGFTGGGGSHNNLPPYLVVNWVIVAGR